MTFTGNACGLRLEYNRVYSWGRGGGGVRGSHRVITKNIYECLHSGVRDCAPHCIVLWVIAFLLFQGALWHIYAAEDADKIRECLREVSLRLVKHPTCQELVACII